MHARGSIGRKIGWWKLTSFLLRSGCRDGGEKDGGGEEEERRRDGETTWTQHVVVS
jgi:hypothetical protein